MKIMYKCHCMTERVELDIPDRQPRTDIVKWMEGLVVNCIGFDHSERSPLCRATEMEYLMIPVDESAEGIGMAPPKPN